ncbi:hypothetical protein G5I_02098 [Acromyrmex echinatior]|uniref:Uncharacterized protein n=1 Tax=Acromyrmex echinatior TaxID=103372 RepID=F4W9E6_ACREC|nr:hypothetical protein G5I_02098 [Acromyrmex echinatior]
MPRVEVYRVEEPDYRGETSAVEIDEGSKSAANVGRSKGMPKAPRHADLCPLGQKYVEAVLRRLRDKASDIDYVYGVYLHKDT